MTNIAFIGAYGDMSLRPALINFPARMTICLDPRGRFLI